MAVDCALPRTTLQVLFLIDASFCCHFPTLVTQVIEMANCAKNFKEFLPYPFSGGTKTGFRVLSRPSDLACTTFADTVSFTRRILSDGKLGLALILISGQRRRLMASKHKVKLINLLY